PIVVAPTAARNALRARQYFHQANPILRVRAAVPIISAIACAGEPSGLRDGGSGELNQRDNEENRRAAGMIRHRRSPACDTRFVPSLDWIEARKRYYWQQK